jgi:alpha-methylacyl-CoA racemase
MRTVDVQGVLHGIRVVEIAGLGPVSFAGMLLADMGADVVRVVRPGHVDLEKGATLRGRTQVTLDLRKPEEQQEALALLAHADVLLEGFRPGVMERLGLGPEAVLARHPSLVYGRMTGWGQHGPRAAVAGHDIDYIAITGALHAVGGDDPVVPLNLVGDYGGGALYLAIGVLAAVVHVRSGGAGQVVDCAICDGTVSLLSLVHGLRHAGRWTDSRQSNTLDGAAPFYRTYRCSDDLHIAVGAIEPPFYRQLLERLGLGGPLFADQHDRSRWVEQAEALQAVFGQSPRAHWDEMFSATDACVAPVNSLAESVCDPHLRSRNAFVDVAGETQPAPVPKFVSTPSRAGPSRDADARQVLAAWTAGIP